MQENEKIKKATEKWVHGFDAIQLSMIETLFNDHPNEWHEITRPTVGARCYAWGKCMTDSDTYDLNGDECTVIEALDNDCYKVELSDEQLAMVPLDNLEMERYSVLPMWGAMWSFSDSIDDWWLSENLQAISDCGFRIYEHAEWGYFFGIDGAGYDFYEEHWIPLYKARGLRWHEFE